MSIYTSHLFSIPFKSELYLNRYDKFIGACLEANKSLPPDVYTEKHHILPKAETMFPQFIDLRKNPWNGIYLTPRQHLVAHLILWKAYGNDAMTHAANMMANFQGRRIGSRLYSKLREDHAAYMSEIAKGMVAVKDKEGNNHYVSVDDPNVLSGEYVSVNKGKCIYFDKDGNSHYVSVDDPNVINGDFFSWNKGYSLFIDKDDVIVRAPIDDERVVSGELKGHTAGKTCFRDSDGNIVFTTVDDERVYNGELVGVVRGFATFRDKEGTIHCVSVDDERVISGDFEHINKKRTIYKDPITGNTYSLYADDPLVVNGTVVGIAKGNHSYRDKDGNIHFVSTNHPKVLSGEFVSSNKGRVVVKDKDGNRIRVTLDDDRYTSGELVHFLKDRKWIHHPLTNEKRQIQQEDLIPDGWVPGMGKRKKKNALL